MILNQMSEQTKCCHVNHQTPIKSF
uniref:Uncharacterized protein n=1 Tax=Anguilla anguilla TaxID=7936 RepID=A0A0E9R5V5_ANGAN